MSDIYKIPSKYTSEALVDKEEYEKMYNESINDPEVFGKNTLKE